MPLLAVAVALPLLVSLLSGHPAMRLIVPESIMFSVAVVLTMIGGSATGLVAVASSTVCLWYFNTDPPYSFVLKRSEDVTAVLLSGAVGATLVLLVSYLRKREQHAADQAAELESQFGEQQSALIALQRALLPESAPTVVGVTVGWHYEAGGRVTAPVGGDWLAVVAAYREGLGVAIGDVAGHGLDAVSNMAQYRFALRTLAATDRSPAGVLAQVDDIARFYRVHTYSTCVYGIVDAEEALFTFTNAGHPPPLLLRDGHVELLDGPHGPPLGLALHPPDYKDTEVPLQGGDIIAMYTDGLVERRGYDLDEGIERLSQRVAQLDPGDDLTDASVAVARDLAEMPLPDDIMIMFTRFE